MNDIITVVIPVYKTEKYLRRCVNSIKKQSYDRLEIILVDDGSPDNCGKICDEMLQEDNRIRVIHKQNGGLSSARNTGIDAAKGKYICFIDSDDYVETDYVSIMYHAIKKYHADLVKVNYIEVDIDNYSDLFSNKTKGITEVLYEGDDVEKAFLDLKIDSACVFLYNKSLIQDIRFPEGKTSEDIPFNFQVFQKAKRFVYLPVNKYYYFHNPESISNGPLNKNYLNYLSFREEIYRYYLLQNNSYLTQKAEVLYARAAMGMMARMGLYGVTPDVNEKEYRKRLSKVFSSHKKAFFKDQNTVLNRKILAIIVFYFYPLLRIVRRAMK